MRIPWQIVVVPALAASSFAWAQAHHHEMAPAVTEASPVASDESFKASMAAAMEHMHAAMAAVRATGQPERDFLGAMIPHHQGAIDMAKAVLLVTKDARIRNLAQSIITEQQYEIELMKTLLAEPLTATSLTPEKYP